MIRPEGGLAAGARPAAGTGGVAVADAHGTSPTDSWERWPVSHSGIAFRGRVVSVRKDRVTAPGGGPAFVRDVVVHPGAVAIVALDDADRVLLVHQYRHPVEHRLWEIPAGLLDVAGEDPLVAAARELAEEARTAATDWRVLVDFYTSPGMTTESLRVYLARGLGPAADQSFVGEDEEADMSVSWVPLTELVEGVLAGRLHNPTLVTGVLAANTALRSVGFDALRPADAPWPDRVLPT